MSISSYQRACVCDNLHGIPLASLLADCNRDRIPRVPLTRTPALCTHRVSFVFGAITMTTGIIGVPLGSYLSQRLSVKHPQADAYICAAGLFISAPLLLGVLFAVRVNIYLAYALIFFGEVALNLNWAIVADILLVRAARHSCIFLFFSPSSSLPSSSTCLVSCGSPSFSFFCNSNLTDTFGLGCNYQSTISNKDRSAPSLSLSDIVY